MIRWNGLWSAAIALVACLGCTGCWGPYLTPTNTDVPAFAIEERPGSLVVGTFELDGREAASDLVGALAERGVEARVGIPDRGELVVEGRLATEPWESPGTGLRPMQQAAGQIQQFFTIITLGLYGGLIPWVAPYEDISGGGPFELIVRDDLGYRVAGLEGRLYARHVVHFWWAADARFMHRARRRVVRDFALELAADGLRDRLTDISASAAR